MKKLILIEEDTDIREMIAFVLENNGFEILREDKQISVDEILTIKPHVIIIGQTSLVKGNDLPAALKSNELSNPIPVIIYAPNLDASKVVNTHADAVIAKPAELDDLVYLANRLAFRN